MKRNLGMLLILSLLAPVASSQTTYTYEYDQFGRLVRVERSAGASTRVRLDYDLVDNRTRVKQGVSSPVANPDYEYITTGYGPFYLDVRSNDTDPDLPHDALTITGISGANSAYGSIWGGTFIDVVGIPPGSYTWTYTIQDAQGHTASATLGIEVLDLICGEFEC